MGGDPALGRAGGGVFSWSSRRADGQKTPRRATPPPSSRPFRRAPDGPRGGRARVFDDETFSPSRRCRSFGPPHRDDRGAAARVQHRCAATELRRGGADAFTGARGRRRSAGEDRDPRDADPDDPAKRRRGTSGGRLRSAPPERGLRGRSAVRVPVDRDVRRRRSRRVDCVHHRWQRRAWFAVHGDRGLRAWAVVSVRRVPRAL